MNKKFHETTDLNKAAVICMLTKINPELKQIEEGSVLFQFPESDEILSIDAQCDERRVIPLVPEKLFLAADYLNTQAARFLAGSRGGGQNG